MHQHCTSNQERGKVIIILFFYFYCAKIYQGCHNQEMILNKFEGAKKLIIKLDLMSKAATLSCSNSLIFQAIFITQSWTSYVFDYICYSTRYRGPSFLSYPCRHDTTWVWVQVRSCMWRFTLNAKILKCWQIRV